MFRAYLSGFALVLVASAAWGQQPAKLHRGSLSARDNTRAILDQVMPDVTFQDTPLETVMNWLQDVTKLNIIPQWQILEDAGLKRDKPISIQAHNLRLTQVLWLIMSEAGGSDMKLAYRASGNLLVFSTAEDLNKEMITKVSDVADLLIQLPMASNQPLFDVTQGMGQNGGTIGGGGTSGGMFQSGTSTGGQYGGNGSTNQQDTQQTHDAAMEKLIALIRDVVEPDSWRENGGAGSISAFQNTIIVRNTILVHQRLGGYVSEEDSVAGQ